MAFTKLPAEGKTCTVRVGLHGEVCGKPAVLAFRRGEEGPEFAECAEHEAPLPTPTKAEKPKGPGRVKCTACGHVHTFGPCGTRVGPGRSETCSCTVF